MDLVIKLGNTAPVELVGADPAGLGGDRVALSDTIGNTITTYRPPVEWGVLEIVQDLSTVFGRNHSDDPPEWVEVYERAKDGKLTIAEGHAVAELLAQQFTYAKKERRQPQVTVWKRDDNGDLELDGDDGQPIVDHLEPEEPTWLPAHECLLGRPDGWKGFDPDDPPPLGGGAGNAHEHDPLFADFPVKWAVARERELRTTAGTDWLASIMGNSAATGAGTGTQRPADFIALSTSATAPAIGDTTLGSEVVTAGLARAQAAYAHTAGAATYTLSKTFTSVTADGTVTVQKMGVFNASSTGTLVFETAFAASVTLQGTQGDQLTVTETVTLS